MSGQTFVTRIRLPQAGHQTQVEAQANAQRLGGASGTVGSRLLADAGIPAGSRIAALIEASTTVATIVPGTFSRDDTITKMDMRIDDLRFRVEFEEPSETDVVLSRTSFESSNAAYCGRENEVHATMLRAWAATGAEPADPGTAGATAPTRDAARSRGAS